MMENHKTFTKVAVPGIEPGNARMSVIHVTTRPPLSVKYHPTLAMEKYVEGSS